MVDITGGSTQKLLPRHLTSFDFTLPLSNVHCSYRSCLVSHSKMLPHGLLSSDRKGEPVGISVLT